MKDRIRIAQRFADIINSDKIVTIILFGSVARGDDTEESDIDILIVPPVAHEIRDEINNVVVDIVINDEEFISAHLMSEDHFNETMNFPFLTNVLEEGMVLG